MKYVFVLQTHVMGCVKVGGAAVHLYRLLDCFETYCDEMVMTCDVAGRGRLLLIVTDVSLVYVLYGDYVTSVIKCDAAVLGTVL